MLLYDGSEGPGNKVLRVGLGRGDLGRTTWNATAYNTLDLSACIQQSRLFFWFDGYARQVGHFTQQSADGREGEGEAVEEMECA